MATTIPWYGRLSLMQRTGLILLILFSTSGQAKHKEKIVAFFQGQCENLGANRCTHLCHNIFDAAYICRCPHNFKLNNDGKTCEVESTTEKPAGQEVASPFEVKVNLEENVAALDKNSVLQHNNHIDTGNVMGQTGVTESDNQSKNRNKQVELPTDNTHRKTKQLEEVKEKSVVLGSSEPKIKIKTYDLRKDLPNPIADFHIREGGDNSIEPQSKSSFMERNRYNPEKRVTCDGIVCANNGTCVVEANIPRCNCPLGAIGERCEKLIKIRFPKFHGMGFLALPILKNGYKEFTISLEFRPEAKNGLLLFSSERENAKADFFSIALLDGYVEFRFDCGTGVGVLLSRGEVTLGHWNRLIIQREENRASLQLNGGNTVQGTAKGAFSRITLRLNLFLGGFSNMSAITWRIGTKKQFVGCIQEVIINSHKYDMRQGGIVGDAEFGLNVGECSEGICDNVVCQNGGTCHARSADSHVCLCPLGAVGDFCEKKLDVHIPKFGGHSYLKYHGLDRKVLSYTEIELVFKPMMPEGAILYNGYTINRKGDFVSLAMREGYLEFRFDLGTGPAVIRSLKPLSMDHWHIARASRTGLQGILVVDGQLRSEGEAQGAYTQLTLLEDLYLGGHKNFDETSKFANLSSSFVGCIQKVVVNKKPLKMMKEVLGGVNVEPCSHPCAGEPCMNGGECVPRQDIYTCYCPLGYSNTNCEDKMVKSPTIPMFIGTSFLMFTEKKILKRVTGNKIDLQFHIRPKGKNGLLFWSGQDTMTSSSDFIALGFVHGGLQLRYNLGSGEAVISYNDSRLFDGQWHFVRAQRDKQDAYLEIDGSEIVEGSAPGSYTMLNTNEILYVGGMPDVTQKTLDKFTSGFVGCIRDFVLATDYKVKLMNEAQSGRNVYECAYSV